MVLFQRETAKELEETDRIQLRVDQIAKVGFAGTLMLNRMQRSKWFFYLFSTLTVYSTDRSWKTDGMEGGGEDIY